MADSASLKSRFDAYLLNESLPQHVGGLGAFRVVRLDELLEVARASVGQRERWVEPHVHGVLQLKDIDQLVDGNERVRISILAAD